MSSNDYIQPGDRDIIIEAVERPGAEPLTLAEFIETNTGPMMGNDEAVLAKARQLRQAEPGEEVPLGIGGGSEKWKRVSSRPWRQSQQYCRRCGRSKQAALRGLIARDPDTDTELHIDWFDQFVEVGFGGEWWSGDLPSDLQEDAVLRHKQERSDPAYAPAKIVFAKEGGDQYKAIITPNNLGRQGPNGIVDDYTPANFTFTLSGGK